MPITKQNSAIQKLSSVGAQSANQEMNKKI